MSDATRDNQVQQSGDIKPKTAVTGNAVLQAQTKDQLAAEPYETQTPCGDIADSSGQKENPTIVPVQNATPESAAKPFQVDRHKAGAESGDKRKEDEKLSIYKALAIKLKKELVKARDELQKLQAEYAAVVGELGQKVETLEMTLQVERVSFSNTSTTLEATCKNLKTQLETAENDLQALQIEFDSYKARATQIMQQNNFSLTNSNRTLEEDRYKQLKALSEEQKNKIKDLNVQIATLTSANGDLLLRMDQLQSQLADFKARSDEYGQLEGKCKRLTKENEHLRQALRQTKERQGANNLVTEPDASIEKSNKSLRTPEQLLVTETAHQFDARPQIDADRLMNEEESAVQVSPSASLKDENQTNSGSSFDSSSYGYVHIKPTAFEIISRTSVLEDAQNQIDNLTKAYLDSESTNSLLTEQVCALKEEIRRLQRGNERMELANNLEYLKNVLFKFLSLDSGQVEQRQRLVPVMSTILKLSPEETQKLSSLSLSEKSGAINTIFKL